MLPASWLYEILLVHNSQLPATLSWEHYQNHETDGWNMRNFYTEMVNNVILPLQHELLFSLPSHSAMQLQLHRSIFFKICKYAHCNYPLNNSSKTMNQRDSETQVVPKYFYCKRRSIGIEWLTMQGTPTLLEISGQVGTIPSLTGALRGQARPYILFLTGRGRSVPPNVLKLDGNFRLTVLCLLESGEW